MAPDDPPDDRDIVLGGGVRDRRGRVPGRVLATAFDLLVGAYVVGAVLAALAATGVIDGPVRVGVGLLLLWVGLVLVEGTVGSSPGKVVAGLCVHDDDGGLAGVRAAALRRPWGWPLPLALVDVDPVRVTVTVAAILVLVAVGVGTWRADDGRGWHDRLAGTTVEVGEVPRTTRTAVLLTLLVLVLVAAVVRATAGGGLPVG